MTTGTADNPETASAPTRGAADLLVEALPYIRRFWGKVVVVKYGGNALAGAGAGDDLADGTTAEDAALASFAEDVVLMRSVGMLPVVVHGGGPQIGTLLERLGMASEFRNGLRVTDADTLDVARMVLVGKVNRDIVSAVNVHAPLAVGVSGEDARLITAAPHAADIGFVGRVDVVDPSLLQSLLAEGLVPVVATIGADSQGQSYNINADTVAGALAASLGAEKLVYLTDVEGVREDKDDPSSLVRRLSVARLEAMLEEGSAAGGMVPKAEACVDAVRRGVHAAHILDGRVPHALLLELFTDGGVGTMVTA